MGRLEEWYDNTRVTLGDGERPLKTVPSSAKARESSQVPVDYTVIKNVKKPGGAKPGMVIYEGYNTVYVKPAIPGSVKK